MQHRIISFLLLILISTPLVDLPVIYCGTQNPSMSSVGENSQIDQDVLDTIESSASVNPEVPDAINYESPSWSFENLNITSDYNERSSIAVDQNGSIHIAWFRYENFFWTEFGNYYVEKSNRTLMYAFNSSIGWQEEIIATNIWCEEHQPFEVELRPFLSLNDAEEVAIAWSDFIQGSYEVCYVQGQMNNWTKHQLTSRLCRRR